MIKVKGSFFRRSNISKAVLPIPEEIFLFVQFFGSEKGQTTNQAEIWYDKSGHEKLDTPFQMPRYTAEQLNGGIGNSPYDQLLDKMQDLIIDHLKEFNPECIFEKI